MLHLAQTLLFLQFMFALENKTSSETINGFRVRTTEIRRSVLMFGIGSQIPLRLLKWAGYKVIDPNTSIMEPNQQILFVTDPESLKVYNFQCNCADGSSTESTIKIKRMKIIKLLVTKLLLK